MAEAESWVNGWECLGLGRGMGTCRGGLGEGRDGGEAVAAWKERIALEEALLGLGGMGTVSGMGAAGAGTLGSVSFWGWVSPLKGKK